MRFFHSRLPAAMAALLVVLAAPAWGSVSLFFNDEDYFEAYKPLIPPGEPNQSVYNHLIDLVNGPFADPEDDGDRRHYDQILTSGTTAEFGHYVRVGKRFVGQTVTTNAAGYDVISGTPTGPLAVLAGEPGENLYAFRHNNFSRSDHVMGGVSGADSVPELKGSMAVWFRRDVPAFFVQPYFSGGTFDITLYTRDGSVLDEFTFNNTDSAFDEIFSYVGFSVSPDVAIGGFTMEVTAGLGVGIGELNLPNYFILVPEPGTGLLLATAAMAVVARRSRRTLR